MAEENASNYEVALSVLSWTDKAKDPIIYSLFRHEKAIDKFVDVLLADLLGLSTEETLKLGSLPAALKESGLRDISICRKRSGNSLPCREAYRLFASYLCLRENMDKMLGYVKSEDEMVKRSRREKRMGVLDRIQKQFQAYYARHPKVIWKGFQDETDKAFLWLGKYKSSRDIQVPTTYSEMESRITSFLFTIQQVPDDKNGQQGDSTPPPPPSYRVSFIDYIMRYLPLIGFTIIGEIILILRFGNWWWLQILVTIVGFGWASQEEDSISDERLRFWGKYSGNLMVIVPWLTKINIISEAVVMPILACYLLVVIIRNYFDDIYDNNESYPAWYPWIVGFLVFIFPLWSDLTNSDSSLRHDLRTILAPFRSENKTLSVTQSSNDKYPWWWINEQVKQIESEPTKE